MSTAVKVLEGLTEEMEKRLEKKLSVAFSSGYVGLLLTILTIGG